jgi:hypothetical protein
LGKRAVRVALLERALQGDNSLGEAARWGGEAWGSA